MDKVEKLNAEKRCPECGLLAPERQIENLGMCERCSMEGKVKTTEGKILNPKQNLLHKWKTETPNAQKTSPILP